MITETIGNPEIFAIEYSMPQSSQSPPIGHCRLWLEKQILGSIDDEVYLTTMCYFLENVLLNQANLFIPEDFLNLSEIKKFELLLEDRIVESGKYDFMPVSGFDGFHKYVYRVANMLHFLWSPDLGFQEIQKTNEYQSNLPQLFSAHVEISVYESTVHNFRERVKTIYNF